MKGGRHHLYIISLKGCFINDAASFILKKKEINYLEGDNCNGYEL
jgi:hypothetical protein